MKSYFAIFFSACILLLSCGKNPAESAASVSSSLSVIPETLDGGASPSPGYEQKIVFKGNLGEQEMEMTWEVNGTLISGSYTVGAEAVSFSAELSREADPRITLKTISEEGIPDGAFQGEWDEKQQLGGEWINTKGNRRIPFSIHPETAAFYFTETDGKSKEVIMEHRTTVMETPEKSCKITYVYPVFSGLPAPLLRVLNEQFKPAPVASRAAELETCMAGGPGSSVIHSFTVHSLSAELLSISLHKAEQAGETGKVIRHSQTRNISLKTGNPVHLNDLFAGDYETYFNNSIREYLATYAGHEVGLTFEGLAEDNNIEIYSDGIVFHFNPGENGPFSAGVVRVPFTAEQILPVINAAGPLRFMVGRAE
ncbi:MAG: RsiV family protein [Bacteroidia bacterium]